MTDIRHIPKSMIVFVESHADILKTKDSITLKEAWGLYKQHVDTVGDTIRVNMAMFREELKNYFGEYIDRTEIDGVRVRGVYKGFKGVIK